MQQILGYVPLRTNSLGFLTIPSTETNSLYLKDTALVPTKLYKQV